MEEGHIVDDANAIKVRKSLAALSITALQKLNLQLVKMNILTEEWCKNFKIIGDQIRRDYHVPKESVPSPAANVPSDNSETMDDPLKGLTIVSEDDEAA